jgi:hypothetical protein
MFMGDVVIVEIYKNGKSKDFVRNIPKKKRYKL